MKPSYCIKVKGQFVYVNRKAIQDLVSVAVTNKRLVAYEADFNKDISALEFIISVSDVTGKSFEEVAYISFPFDDHAKFEKIEDVIFL